MPQMFALYAPDDLAEKIRRGFAVRQAAGDGNMSRYIVSLIDEDRLPGADGSPAKKQALRKSLAPHVVSAIRAYAAYAGRSALDDRAPIDVNLHAARKILWREKLLCRVTGQTFGFSRCPRWHNGPLSPKPPVLKDRRAEWRKLVQAYSTYKTEFAAWRAELDGLCGPAPDGFFEALEK